jgi:putative hydrolase of the HAD superfamily
MGIRAVFFDLDDTLVAFDAVTEPSWRRVCADYCACTPGADPARLYTTIRELSSRYWSDPERHRIGRLDIVAARKAFVRDAFSTLGLPAADAEELAVTYSRVRTENMYLLPGARQTLEALGARGMKMTLITNGDSEGQRAKIQRFDLGRYFAAILIEGELGFGKPDPRVYKAALSAAGVPPRNAVMVGDNPDWDVKPAAAEGIGTVWIDRGAFVDPRPRGIVPDWTISGIGDLLAALGLERMRL